MKKKLEALLAEYGPIALAVYLVIFVVVFMAFSAAIGTGFEPDGVAQGAGLLGAAYLATKVTQPFRIGATFLLTPLVAKVIRRGKRGTPEPTGEEEV